jgi:hypothetical protein
MLRSRSLCIAENPLLCFPALVSIEAAFPFSAVAFSYSNTAWLCSATARAATGKGCEAGWEPKDPLSRASSGMGKRISQRFVAVLPIMACSIGEGRT